MKYLGVVDSLGTGGAERSNADLWMYLRQRGVSVRVVVMRHRKEGTQDEILAAGFDVHFLRPGNLLAHAREIARVIGDWRPDVVHSTLFKSNLRVRLAKLFTGRFLHLESLVNTTYTRSRLADPAVNYFNLTAYWMLDTATVNLLADGYHAITQAVADHYHQRLFIPHRKMKVISRGRNANQFRNDATLRAAYHREFGIQEGDSVIITTGRQEYQKAHTLAINALGELKNTVGYRAFKYIMLGRAGTATDEIRQRVAHYDLGEQVIFTGHRYDVEQILPVGDLFFFPSRYEGLGVSLIEAQAAGLPVLCSDLPVFRETTTSSGTLYVDPYDSMTTAQTIASLLADPARRQRMGAENLRNFHNRFLLDKVHADMLDYFNHMVEQYEY